MWWVEIDLGAKIDHYNAAIIEQVIEGGNDGVRGKYTIRSPIQITGS